MRPLTITTSLAMTVAMLGAAAAQTAEPTTPFRAEGFEYGPRNDLPEGEEAEIWNPAKRKLMAGGPMIGGTVRSTDPRMYCAMASAGYDFIWVEKQHEATEWEQTARMWRTCPGPAAPGARVAFENEKEIQTATDMGALVVVVPTVDSVEEAQRAIDWTYFPPFGRRSSGGGQGPDDLWGEVPGGYRETWNDNVVLVLMIETLEGVENAREIAALPGVSALFAAAGDLGNFSGYEEGDPEYEALITEVGAAAEAAGVGLCGPLRWASRPGFTCFQATSEDSHIARGAEAELATANEAYRTTGSGAGAAGAASATEAVAATALVAEISAGCSSIVYEADCFAAIERALAGAEDLPAEELEPVRVRISEVIAANPTEAERIREIVGESNVELGDI